MMTLQSVISGWTDTPYQKYYLTVSWSIILCQAPLMKELLRMFSLCTDSYATGYTITAKHYVVYLHIASHICLV